MGGRLNRLIYNTQHSVMVGVGRYLEKKMTSYGIHKVKKKNHANSVPNSLRDPEKITFSVQVSAPPSVK